MNCKACNKSDRFGDRTFSCNDCTPETMVNFEPIPVDNTTETAVNFEVALRKLLAEHLQRGLSVSLVVGTLAILQGEIIFSFSKLNNKGGGN